MQCYVHAVIIELVKFFKSYMVIVPTPGTFRFDGYRSDIDMLNKYFDTYDVSAYLSVSASVC